MPHFPFLTKILGLFGIQAELELQYILLERPNNHLELQAYDQMRASLARMRFYLDIERSEP